MPVKSTNDPVAPRRRGRLKAEIRDALRELTIQLAMLNRQVGAHLELRDVDLDCLNLLDRRGPLSPKELALQVGVHPATLTGILDRLERDGWVARDRDPDTADKWLGVHREGLNLNFAEAHLPKLLQNPVEADDR